MEMFFVDLIFILCVIGIWTVGRYIKTQLRFWNKKYQTKRKEKKTWREIFDDLLIEMDKRCVKKEVEKKEQEEDLS